jgi:hypothetical protein
MKFKWTKIELAGKSDAEITCIILAEKMNGLSPRSLLYNRLQRIIKDKNRQGITNVRDNAVQSKAASYKTIWESIYAKDRQLKKQQKDIVVQEEMVPRVIIRIEGGNFQGASANTYVYLSVLDIDNKNACDPVDNKDDLAYYRSLEKEVKKLKPIH